jgi:hypothetical protein
MANRAVTVCRETLGQATKHYPLGGIFAAIVPMAVLHDDRGGESNPIRVIDAFVDALDLAVLGFGGVGPETTGLPAYRSSTHQMLYIYISTVISTECSPAGGLRGGCCTEGFLGTTCAPQ